MKSHSRKIEAVALAFALLPALCLAQTAAQSATQALPQACTLKLHMDGHGRVYEGHHRLGHDALIERLQTGCPTGTLNILLDASPQASYGKVIDLTGMIKQYGPPGTQLALSTGKTR